jgi:DNA (cytosine-5)-methyltransferase 1
MNERPLIIEIFPGISLLGRAFEEEWPEACIARGPDLLWGGDIRRFHPPAGKFDGVIGGPPCKAFSGLANLVRARGYEPRHGNLIPEYERVVSEAKPAWFVMENVPAAPEPSVAGYGICHFRLDNYWLGEEQARLRRFSFGIRGSQAVDLRSWIELAALMLPGPLPTVTQARVDNPDEANGRTMARTVTAAHAGAGRPRAKGRIARYSVAEAARLQGVPDLVGRLDGVFTAQAKLEVIANGVPLPMGRAIAKAVRRALRHSEPTP